MFVVVAGVVVVVVVVVAAAVHLIFGVAETGQVTTTIFSWSTFEHLLDSFFLLVKNFF